MIKFLPFVLIFSFSSISFAQNMESPDPIVTISTNVGDIVIRLFEQEALVTVKNFLAYVDEGFYNGTIFHRVVQNFMIQGGGFTSNMVQKETREPIKNESRNRLHNVRGTIAMARTSQPDSATAQFFINQRSNLNLDWMPGAQGYAVFGEVTSGMNVVDFIATSETRSMRGFKNVPVEPIVIIEISRN